MRKTLFVNEIKPGDIIFRNGQAILIKYVDVGPKSVYIKTHEGKQLSYQITDKLDVMTIT